MLFASLKLLKVLTSDVIGKTSTGGQIVLLFSTFFFFAAINKKTNTDAMELNGKMEFKKTFIAKPMGETRGKVCLVAVSLLLLVLPMGYHIAQVLVIQVSSNIQGEVGEHLVHLKVK